MLVDDSVVIRSALARLIAKDPVIKIVASVSNGEMGISSAKKHQPHVVILDIEMPVMDGLSALPKILEAAPGTKVIMFSSLTASGADVTMKALSLGAVECIVKPSTRQSVGEGSDFQRELLEKIKSLVPDDKRRVLDQPAPAPQASTGAAPLAPSAKDSFTLHRNPLAYKGKPSIVAIGSSTGGPQALFNVIKHFQGFDVPIIITQHMPATFTTLLASHITQQTGVPCVEGANGMVIEKGKAYVAPGGFHMLLINEGMKTTIKLDEGPPENFCKPSVDPMFRSAQKIYGQKMLGVILTGMGNDGLPSGKALVEAGGRLIAQDQATSVVWGMPGAVAKAGLCTEVLPIQDIGPWVRRAVLG